MELRERTRRDESVWERWQELLGEEKEQEQERVEGGR